MSRFFRGIGLVALMVAFFGACVDEQPPADYADTNQPLLLDMGECDGELDEACFGDFEEEVW